jgi:hypothetical protein
MEYNVENLFDMVDDGIEYPEFKPGANNWTLSIFQKKINNIADVIAAVNADIGVWVEIENENTVKQLLSALKKKKCDYPYFALGDKPVRTNTMPVIFSRFPLFNIRNYAYPLNKDSIISRNLLESDVFLGRDTLTVFACHWPSKKEPESRRAVAAEFLKSKLVQLPRNAQYLVAGDLNENYDECANFHTLGLDDSYGVTGINHILGTVRAQRGSFAEYMTKENMPDSGKLHLFDPWLEIPEEKRMNEMYRRQRNTPDHILLSAGLFDASGLSYVDTSFRVFTWNGLLLFNNAPYRWQMRFEGKEKYHRGEGYSDHLPILLKVCKGPFRGNGSATGTTMKKINNSSIKTIGFETGAEGWISCAANSVLSRDTNNPRSGFYCLKLAAAAPKQNGCAARALISCRLGDDSLQHFYSMSIRGHGMLSFRIRATKNKKWTYYNGPDFKSAKGAKYTLYDFPKWEALRLPLPFESNFIKEIEVEIRIKKETDMTLWIDDISVI